MSSHPHSKKFQKDNNFWLSEKHCCCNCNYKFRMPILRLHSIFPILESLYGRIPSLICIEIINLKNHSWQVSWNVKADIIIIIMVTYRHAVPRKKKNRFQFKCYSETKIFGHAKSQQHQDQSLYYPEGLHVFFFSVKSCIWLCPLTNLMQLLPWKGMNSFDLHFWNQNFYALSSYVCIYVSAAFSVVKKNIKTRHAVPK